MMIPPSGRFVRRGAIALVLLCLVSLISVRYYSGEFVGFSQVAYPNVSLLRSHETTTTPESTTTPDNDGISLVHLMSYQRSGSSFMGGLFTSNPEAFVMFEPLDMLYSAMYGINPGWTVPSDIFYNIDGSLRNIPEEEMSMMTWMIDRVFTCDMSSLPVSMLVHPFWYMFRKQMPDAQDYLNCMTSKHADLGDRSPATLCLTRLVSVCPRRFEGEARNLKLCRNVLWNAGSWEANATEINAAPRAYSSAFQMYFSCLAKYAEPARECAMTHLDRKCEGRNIRVVKTVRAPMEVSERLLQHHTNSRVIQLLRDPRGATRSRSGSSWSWGRGEGPSAYDHAKRYCPNAVRDYKQLQTLSKTYPGRAMHVVYDGFVLSPMETTRDIYKTVGKPVPMETEEWLAMETSAQLKNVTNTLTGKILTKEILDRRNSTAVAVAWNSFFTYQQMSDVTDVCRQFFEIIDYPWI